MDKNTENMLAGKPYSPGTPESNKFSHLAHRLCRDYNLTTDEDTVELTLNMANQLQLAITVGLQAM